MWQNPFGGSDQEHHRELQPFGLVNGHQRNPVSLLLESRLAAMLVPFRNIINKINKSLDAIKTFR
ncbi:hypothetical protein D3C78_1943810 [compost metagenome]